MKTVTYGTLEEWSNIEPDAMLINRKINFMSDGCYVQFPQMFLDPREAVYYSNSHTPDTNTGYADPFYYCGAGAVLTKIRAKHKYFVSVGTIYGTGALTYPIAKRHWDDPNWEKVVDLKELCK